MRTPCIVSRVCTICGESHPILALYFYSKHRKRAVPNTLRFAFETAPFIGF